MRYPKYLVLAACITASALLPAACAIDPAQAADIPSIRVQGNHLEDGNGKVVQLRGANVSGLEFVAVQGWSANNPWGGATGEPTPAWSSLKRWQMNAVRIPLNEASWLGFKCKNADGSLRDPDPGRNYKEVVRRAVKGASDAGYYVIIDLHWNAPANFCPLAQNPMADKDNSLTFWTQVATEFKDRPNVLFELFNEPYFWWIAKGASDWGVLRDGGVMTQYVTGDAAKYQASYEWQVAGMQAMLNAVRTTGATNVVLIGAPSWSQDLSKWVAYKPDDPLRQIAAVWHAYPNGESGAKAAEPKFGNQAWSWTQAVLDAGYPVIITEFGDHNEAGTKGSPFVSKLLPWADKAGASYLGWTWNVWQNKDNVLIKDSGGSPTDGYGDYTKRHYLCRAEGKDACP